MAEVTTAASQESAPVESETLTVNYQPASESFPCTYDTPPTHPIPGDPEPITPPTGGDAPPDGSGDPPIDEPSSPGGVGEPA